MKIKYQVIAPENRNRSFRIKGQDVKNASAVAMFPPVISFGKNMIPEVTIQSSAFMSVDIGKLSGGGD